MYTLLKTDNYFTKNEMISYPNLLTPPSSNEDSPGSVNVSSPIFTPSYQFTMNDMILADPYQPYLHIVEEPIDKFRFRYKSEMSGTHGSLSGMKSDRSRKQTYPTVELHNVTTSAIIRCSIYQYNNSNIEELRQPHAHRLIKKVGNEDQDDPHDIQVSPEDGYQASFHSMGIIHTAKKHIVKELLNKKKKLKIEDNARREGIKRPLTQKEETELQQLAENESKTINLNIVCLRFDAFVENNGILHQICKPVYSHAINNLKSALTGELKIVRMDHCSSPCSGGREIYILVEKVTKKNIKVRFYELDDDENEVWNGYGKFNDLDVHHQYAIVFKTPAYKTQNLDQHKKVFIELERPSDGARSEPKDFVFTPNVNVPVGSKRPRTNYSSSSSYNSYGNSSGELPTIVTNMTYPPNVETNLFGEDLDLITVSKLIDSDDFKEMCHKDPDLWRMFSSENMVIDSPIKQETGTEISYVSSEEFSSAERAGFESECKNLISFIKTRPPKDRIVGKLRSLFNTNLNNQGDKLLHMSIKGNVAYVTNLIIGLTCSETGLLNTPNNSGRTALHQAVLCNNIIFVKELLAYNANHSSKDVDGNTPLHLAVKRKCSYDIFLLLVRNNKMLDTENSEGETALHLAVSENMLPVVKLLSENNADINIIDKKDGKTILHKAIEMGSYEMVKYLLDETSINLIKEDYSGNNPLKIALTLIDDGKPQQTMIYDYLKICLINKNLPSEVDVKGEIDSEEEIEEMDLDEHLIKLENLSPEELEEKYKDVTKIPKMYLEELVEILDKSGNWHSLAQLLDLEYLFNSSIVDINDSPSKNLLSAALANGESILHIRNFLENLEETRAVSVLDKMVLNR